MYQDIVEGISAGTFVPGDLLPSESEMERQYKTSRTPIRQALRELETEGYIYRLQGKGSFVSHHNPRGRWAQTTGFEHHYYANGGQISAQTLSVGHRVHSEYAKVLHVDPDAPLLCIVRLRTMNDIPVLYLKHYISPNVGVSYEATKGAGDFVSKDAFYAESANIEVSEIEERLVAVHAGEEAGKYLGIEPSTPIIHIRRASSALGIGPVDVTEYSVRTDVWDYVTHYRNS
ncbi:GntR family transcriptional regulator [Brevibacterium oceani]|uniref:GntR family transcriptional regulator n=1 Tax=Brevibacterium oceani TaxID=358099 RepID=UPI001B33670F|nr:GntR family transcriptional regulator [Brevibacterium oceani]